MSYVYRFWYLSILTTTICCTAFGNQPSQTAANEPTSITQGRLFWDPTTGNNDKLITDKEVVEFLDSLKEALKNEDYRKFSTLISYPCNWNKKRERLVINSPEEFLEHKEEILTPIIKDAILKANPNKLFVNIDGFMIGNGEVWFMPGRGIITFNIN